MTLARTRKTIDTKGVGAVMDAAEEAARREGHRVVIAVVDAGGTLLALRRTEGAQLASSQVAIDKARTAAIFVRPSRELEAQVSAGRLGALALHGAVALTGGVPLTVDGEVVGAIGTSGETPDEDESVSLAGAAALYRRPSKDFEDQASGGRPSALHLAGAVPLQGGMPLLSAGEVIGAIGVSGASTAAEDQALAALGARVAELAGRGPAPATLLAAGEIDLAFAHGGLLVDTPRYQLDAARRSGPGEVECHDTVTDVMRVVEGTATVVTGIGDAAVTHELGRDDVLVIPAGLPHEFTAASDPFHYLVVKVAS